MTPKTQQGEAPDPVRSALVFLRNKAYSDCRGDAYSNQDAAFAAGVEAALHEYDVARSAPSPSPAVREALAELLDALKDQSMPNGMSPALFNAIGRARSALSAPSVPPDGAEVRPPVREFRRELFDAKAFADAVKSAMERRGWTAKQLSEATGVNETTLSRMWSGDRACDAASLAALAGWAGMNPISYCTLPDTRSAPSVPPVEAPGTVPWPVVTSYSGGASQEGVGGRVWIRMGDGQEVEYAPVGEQP